MRCFKLNHEPQKNEIIWFVIEDNTVYWIGTHGHFHESIDSNDSVEHLTQKCDYIEVSPEKFYKFLLTEKLKK